MEIGRMVGTVHSFLRLTGSLFAANSVIVTWLIRCTVDI